MPGFAKSPTELVARFHAVTDDLPDMEHRRMFGYPALFVGGNLVSGLYESTWFVRLAEPDREALLALPGSGPVEIMPGRAMSGYVALPPSMIEADEPALRGWLDRAAVFGRSLPAKSPRPRRGAG